MRDVMSGTRRKASKLNIIGNSCLSEEKNKKIKKIVADYFDFFFFFAKEALNEVSKTIFFSLNLLQNYP